jgi:hypothetical protein
VTAACAKGAVLWGGAGELAGARSSCCWRERTVVRISTLLPRLSAWRHASAAAMRLLPLLPPLLLPPLLLPLLLLLLLAGTAATATGRAGWGPISGLSVVAVVVILAVAVRVASCCGGAAPVPMPDSISGTVMTVVAAWSRGRETLGCSIDTH